jgi:hypothetical protein
MLKDRMEDNPSERLVEQRIRNRIMEAVLTLAEGVDGVRQVWPKDYFETFYDWIPHQADGAMPSNSAINDEERALLAEVSAILDSACDATPNQMTADELLATGWPDRVQPVAQRALSAMILRGRFSEDHEEDEPSTNRELWP